MYPSIPVIFTKAKRKRRVAGPIRRSRHTKTLKRIFTINRKSRIF